MVDEKTLRIDKTLMFIWPVVAALLSFIFSANFLVSVLLFFGVPSIYISLKNRSMVLKQILFSLPAFIIVIVIDYICEIMGVWFVPQSVFEYRVLGVVTIDIMFWFFLYTYFIVAYHGYFLEHRYKDKPYYPKLKYLYIYFTLILVLFFAAFFINQEWLHIRYFYLIFGTIMAIIPVVFVAIKMPNLLTKLTKSGIYFFFVTLIYELTALSLGQWTFPGTDFIGHVTLFGLTFPFEELFFWIMLGAIAILSYYEFFDDKAGEKTHLV